MKVYEIKDDKRVYGYLIYYKRSKSFYIELNDKVKDKDFPLFFESFVSRKKYSINSYWSLIWVKQRIVPPDRQNIGDFLKDAKIEEYDEFTFLVLNHGRCSQDDLYLNEVSETNIINSIKKRLDRRLEDVIINKSGLLCFFVDGTTKKVSYEDLGIIDKRMKSLLNYYVLNNYRIEQDGYGIIFNGIISISYDELYTHGKVVDVNINDFLYFIEKRIINTSQACDILKCSRQNINDLVKRDKIHPIRIDEKNLLFYRNEIEQRSGRL